MSGDLGRLNRTVRFILGVVVLGLYGALDSPWRYLTLVGLLFITTAATGRRLRSGIRRRRSETSSGGPPREGHSAAWWRAHHPEDEDRTWPPKPPPKWRPGDHA